MHSHWISQAIIYHIYVRSFMDSNCDGVGDLPGLISKIGYLEILGINTIWLSPIYPSPMADFGYDVSDYQGIDPLFGAMSDFDKLIQVAHEKKIKVLMDYIPNHTSSKHAWFIESQKSIQSPKRDWYIWRQLKSDGSPPNNWVSVFGGSAWELDPKTGEYYLHSFDKEQPDLNWRNPQVVEAMKTALRFWLDKGVDGFRVDAYDFLFKHDEYLDEPFNPEYDSGKHGIHDSLVHIYSFSQPETLVMLKEIAEVLEEYQDTFMVTEVYATADKLYEMYDKVDKAWYAPFNFSLIRLPWSAQVHKNFIDTFDKKVGQKYLPTYVLGNHDQSRVGTRVGLAQARNAAILLLTLRGIPFIYYGDELGMTDGEIPPHKIQDPFELKSPGLKLGRDPERTPMQWSPEKNAGFTTGEPWLPLNPTYTSDNVVSELENTHSFLSLYKKLIELRLASQALTSGAYQSLEVNNEQVYGFTRKSATESWLILLNYSSQTQLVELPAITGEVRVDSLYSSEGTTLNQATEFSLLANQGLVLKLAT